MPETHMYLGIPRSWWILLRQIMAFGWTLLRQIMAFGWTLLRRIMASGWTLLRQTIGFMLIKRYRKLISPRTKPRAISTRLTIGGGSSSISLRVYGAADNDGQEDEYNFFMGCVWVGHALHQHNALLKFVIYFDNVHNSTVERPDI